MNNTFDLTEKELNSHIIQSDRLTHFMLMSDKVINLIRFEGKVKLLVIIKDDDAITISNVDDINKDFFFSDWECSVQ